MSKVNTIVSMNGFVEYARVFPENMDDNMDFHAATQGQYNMNFYPATEEEASKFFDAGAPTSSMGHDTLKDGNPNLGIGKFLKLKRPNVHPKVADFGGAPKVFDFTDGASTKRWSFEDGELGNGTEVAVKVSLWGSKKGDSRMSIRLEKIAVVNHVEFDGAPAEREDAF